jgi:serine/threonine-protein kinase
LTAAYAAPEQLTQGAVTTATDIYALGMLLFELLSGDRPWRLTELPLVAGLEKVLREAPPPVSATAERRPDTPITPGLLRGTNRSWRVPARGFMSLAASCVGIGC